MYFFVCIFIYGFIRVLIGGKIEKTNSFYFVFANPHALLFSSYKTFEYCDLFVNYLLNWVFLNISLISRLYIGIGVIIYWYPFNILMATF